MSDLFILTKCIKIFIKSIIQERNIIQNYKFCNILISSQEFSRDII